MSMDDFIYKYFIDPIVSKNGYNPINTMTYALIAIVSLYAILHLFKNKKINVGEDFIFNVLTFVLIGSTARVVTDAVDSGVFKPITQLHSFVLNSHVYEYSYLSVSPGIYIVIAFLLFFIFGILRVFKQEQHLGKVGAVLWLPHFIMLIPFMQYAVYAVPILILAVIPAYLSYKYFKNKIPSFVVAGHALDGAATFFIIDYYSKFTGKIYFEQHFFARWIADNIGIYFESVGIGKYFAFYLIKVLISFYIVYLFSKEKMPEDEKNFWLLAIMIMGFAPGLRDLLRMMAGT